ncbi:IS1096 element passenger TnpR family protein [Halobacillus amylolyticus]
MELLGTQTLLELHHAIQQIFDMSDDHLYAFYMDGKKFGEQRLSLP